ncbi:hypothetical protein SAMN05421833_102416 [Microbispora rosea]|uniref:Uncharacterized protein n=1 Tax=Microbispora rosea TaxID=58117 RepID=A0A1N6TMY3_9ACTN|nr:hypothetical protein Mro03_01860 [Microbispora rosea subsp. rosea]SIQ54607.1 hypothetical protein SAMN05421833_102416 [Microbispora rosea]
MHGNVAYGLDRTTNTAFGQTRVMNVQSIAESVAQAGGTFAAVQFYAVQNHGTVYGDPKHLCTCSREVNAIPGPTPRWI